MSAALLVAMQAAGMVVDYMGTKYQSELIEMGSRIMQAGIESNIEQTRLEAEDASLQAMIKLRKTLGSQLAIYAARGTNPGAGSAMGIFQGNISNFNADERMRRINLKGREAELKGKGAIARLQEFGEVSKLWQGWASRTFNKFSSGASGMGGGK